MSLHQRNSFFTALPSFNPAQPKSATKSENKTLPKQHPDHKSYEQRWLPHIKPEDNPGSKACGNQDQKVIQSALADTKEKTFVGFLG